MESRVQRDIRFLKAYAIMLTVLLAGVVVYGFTWADQKTRFDEIDVARINIVEKDGTVKLIISNKERAPDAIINGKTYPRQGGNSAGIIFLNDKGDECGGLTFSGAEKDGKAGAGAVLLFDQFNQDQTVGITYSERAGRRSAGFNVWDRPDTPIWETLKTWDAIQAMKDGPEKTDAIKKLQESGAAGARRIFVGKDPDKAAQVVLCDARGKPRIRMIVDAAGAARLEFLDEAGKVTSSLPDDSKKR